MSTAHKHLSTQARRIAWNRKYYLAIAKNLYKLGLEQSMYVVLFEMLIAEEGI